MATTTIVTANIKAEMMPSAGSCFPESTVKIRIILAAKVPMAAIIPM
jgi:hypothetical protein